MLSGSSKETLSYQANLFKHHVPDFIQLLSQMIRYPSLLDEEIQETLLTTQYELEDHLKKVDERMTDLSHQAAFKNHPLGYPQFCLPNDLSLITRESLNRFRQRHFHPSNFVFAAVGVDHDEFVESIQSSFGDMDSSALYSSSDKGMTRTPAVYSGGTMTCLDETLPLTHCCVSFKSPSFLDSDIYAVSILQMLLGGGDSFSAGGPGKGMYSRLYTNVLSRFVAMIFFIFFAMKELN